MHKLGPSRSQLHYPCPAKRLAALELITSKAVSRWTPIPQISCRHYARRRQVNQPSLTGRIESQARRDQRLLREKEAAERAAQPWIRIRPRQVLVMAVVGLAIYGGYIFQTDQSRSLVLNPQFFTPFILKSVDRHSPTCSTFNLLSVPAGQNTTHITDAWRRGIWSIQVMQPELQIARAYTPLPPSQVEGVQEDHQMVRLFIRREDSGEVSRFLHGLNPGTLVHQRGPHIEYEISPDVDEILFLAGGTGIAPAMQAAYTAFVAQAAQRSSVPRMHVMWANRQRIDSKDIEDHQARDFRTSLAEKVKSVVKLNAKGTPEVTQALDTVEIKDIDQLQRQKHLIHEIDAMVHRSGGRFSIDYYVDEEKTYVTRNVLQSYLAASTSPTGKTSARPENNEAPDSQVPKKRLLLISGPNGFIEYYAGAKEWQDGKEISGPLGGILSSMNHAGWDIWKL